MHIYILFKKHGSWSNGSSKTMIKKLCDLIAFKDELAFEQGKPVFINSNYFLSVSHSSNLMAIAIADQEIGIDLEKDRTIEKDVIERLNLDLNSPLDDWCKREATIKLYNDAKYLFTPAPLETLYTDENIFDGYTCMVASKIKIEHSKIFHLDEQAL